jgi:hypothetical protein
MNTDKLSGRELKNKIFDLLSQKNFKKSLKEICRLPARQVVNPLFSFLFSLDENLKWRSITAFGEVANRLAESDLESARIIMRRLMWSIQLFWFHISGPTETFWNTKYYREGFYGVWADLLMPDPNWSHMPPHFFRPF